MPENLRELWLHTLKQNPSATAVIESDSGKVWSRADLDAAADAWVEGLGRENALAHKIVALAEPNSAGWMAIFIGLLKAGAIILPLDSAEPEPARISTAKAAGAHALWQQSGLLRLGSGRKARNREVCLIKLTSGSTGMPQPLPFTHAQLIADGRQVCAAMEIGPDDLNLGVIPFGHSYGLGNLVMPLLVQGTPLIASASPLPNALAADCARWKPTVFPAVPTLLRALALTDTDPSAIASLRLVISAGAPLGAELAAAFANRFGIRIHSFYGSSETGGITYDRTGEATLEGRSVGTLIQGVTLSFKRSGRFEVTSPAVMRSGSHLPPDRGRLNAQGELVLLGRSGRSAKIAGRRVDLSEVEKLIRSISGVGDAFAVVHPSRPDSLAALVSGAVDSQLLRQELRKRTALWKIPARLVIVEDLPRTSRGKIDRKKAQALLAD